MFGPCFVVLSSFAIILRKKRERELVDLLVFLLSCRCLCSVSLPPRAVG